ncbi:MAG: ATP-grasp domain-containing protein [Candidatus Omnitrophota bacterium]|nr:ATP-grasp domain-containing protein [Candidatus Omnitrophota bacterium]
MKRILVLATNASDAKSVVLWGLREAGHQCLVMGNLSKNTELPHSPLCRKFYAIPEEYSFEKKSPEIVPLIRRVLEQNDIDVICPSGFESVKFLSLFLDQLTQMKFCVPVPALETIKELSDKYVFASLCRNYGIPHPQTYLLENMNAVEENRLLVKFPLLTKPLRMSASKGIYTFQGRDELLQYLKTKKEDGSNALPLLLQEYIPGFDIDFNGFGYQGRLSAWTIQKFIEIPRDKKQPLRWLQFLRNDEILRIGKTIVEKTGYSGPIHVDLRVEEHSGRVYAIEVNPRFWASTFASMSDGVNFADVAIQCAINPHYQKAPRYACRIWGSPHHLPYLLLRHPNREMWQLACQHTLFQVRHVLFNQLLFGQIARKGVLIREGT